MTALRVLIVEDEFLVADYLADLLQQAGHQVVRMLDSAEDALSEVAPTDFDVAILDIRLRGAMDGIELARRLGEAYPPLRHIYISGSGDPETRARALATAPLAFLQKPIRPDELRAALSASA